VTVPRRTPALSNAPVSEAYGTDTAELAVISWWEAPNTAASKSGAPHRPGHPKAR
jgi:hypothetical protein